VRAGVEDGSLATMKLWVLNLEAEQDCVKAEKLGSEGVEGCVDERCMPGSSGACGVKIGIDKGNTAER
jgi:hypothetical protein